MIISKRLEGVATLKSETENRKARYINFAVSSTGSLLCSKALKVAKKDWSGALVAVILENNLSAASELNAEP